MYSRFVLYFRATELVLLFISILIFVADVLHFTKQIYSPYILARNSTAYDASTTSYLILFNSKNNHCLTNAAL